MEPLRSESGTNLSAMPIGLMRPTCLAIPNEPGFCLFRMKYPPNYHVPPHIHWMAEHTTVLEGEAWIGLGDSAPERG
jgi:hypothetical protein